jgi:hypothetical protein
MQECVTTPVAEVRWLLVLLVHRLAMRRRVRRFVLGRVLRKRWHGSI